MNSSRRVLVALSGGIDSAVSTFLLLKQGFSVHAVFMQNWDARDEMTSGRSSNSGSKCTVDRDWYDVQRISDRLKIPCSRHQFIKEYWQEVFEPALDLYTQGPTPNPDIECNRKIKFGAFYDKFMSDPPLHLDFQDRFGTKTNGAAQWTASGHYARLSVFGNDSMPSLLQGIDPTKDQSYFLATVPRDRFRQHLFPVGEMIKTEVRHMAKEIGLDFLLNKRETSGICFVGRRPHFRSFLEDYVSPQRGHFVDIRDLSGVQQNTVTLEKISLGSHDGVHAFTVGQSARIKSAPSRYFVLAKDPVRQILYVTRDQRHPGFYSLQCQLQGSIRDGEIAERARLEAKVRYRSPNVPCRLDSDGKTIIFDQPVYGLAPGQVLALYAGDVCLGGRMVCNVKTMAEGISPIL